MSFLNFSDNIPTFETHIKNQDFYHKSVIFERLLIRAPKIGEDWLNRQITSNHGSEAKKPNEPTEVFFNFELFQRRPEDRKAESLAIRQMLQQGQRELLKHPLTEAFVYLKWEKLNWAFYLTFAYHLLLALLITLTAFVELKSHFFLWSSISKTILCCLLVVFYIPCFLKLVFLGLFQRSTFWLSTWIQIKRPCPPIPLPSLTSLLYIGKLL